MDNGRHNRISPACFVIFGGAGDLNWRKLTPALFHLFADNALPESFSVIALDRGEMATEDLRRRLRDGVSRFSRSQFQEDRWNSFADHISYLRGDFADEAPYKQLAETLQEVDQQHEQRAARIFYLATPPSLFSVIPPMLSRAGLTEDRKRARIVVEKPIGYDLDSALHLNRTLAECFDETQIFRIDHYLGKETVQNILAFRFANALFEPIWDRRYVDHVAITVAESVGIAHRGEYYDHAGALRDMVQNHLLQLLCLVAMEPPVSFDSQEIRNKKVDVLHAVRQIAHERVHDYAARGQYASGWVQGQHVASYRGEEDVSAGSTTETFVALKLFVDNWRWQDVPFYLRTGKRLPQHVSEISFRFRAVPHQSFPAEATLDWQPARLVMCIQPDEGIVLKFQAKQPGPRMRLRPVDMRFNYSESFDRASPDAYETLLWDVMKNDATLFMRSDQVEAAWRILMPILEVWSSSPPSDFPNYAAGTWGPESAESLIARDGRNWLQPTLLKTTQGK